MVGLIKGRIQNILSISYKLLIHFHLAAFASVRKAERGHRSGRNTVTKNEEQEAASHLCSFSGWIYRDDTELLSTLCEFFSGTNNLE